jgi:hypothetical protein
VNGIEVPAAHGITNARSLASMYAALLADVDGTRLLSRDMLAAGDPRWATLLAAIHKLNLSARHEPAPPAQSLFPSMQRGSAPGADVCWAHVLVPSARIGQPRAGPVVYFAAATDAPRSITGESGSWPGRGVIAADTRSGVRPSVQPLLRHLANASE